MKNHRMFALLPVTAALILLLFASCGNDAVVLPDWLPEAAAEQAPVSWTADYTAGALTFVSGQTSSLCWRYRGTDLPAAEQSSFASTSSSLTFSQLASLTDALLSWLAEETSELTAEDFSLAFAQPDAFYQGGGLSSGKRLLIYSIGDASFTECDAVYNGSQKYGAVTLYFVDGPWQVLIDN